MQPILDQYTARTLAPGAGSPSDGGLIASLAFLAFLALALVAASYPLLSAGALALAVALAISARSLARHVDPDTVRRVSLPGIGTLEYRFTRT
ncbi:hypothetical protein U4E84_12660 [Halorubrum sp. AD140]|uniref:hypothetical protein n=1 Tax=Halorubrum sp. AD140 TaxID=3050073 RepID=UPI002ACD1759|nr:hypothetical protein [Halorubrum sp. AD140]MDZ5812193.1 hypothetical protein [Halorubrum sp. AD140]